MTQVQGPEAAAEPVPDGERGCQAAAIAETVGAVLAHTADAAAPHNPANAAEIRAITDAMVRLFVGAPLRSDGQLTVKSLAEEAGLRRNKLTHKHTGLKDLFYALAKAQQAPPQPFTDKEREASDKQKKDLTRVRAERDSLRAKTQQMARVIHVLEVENHQLRQSAGTDGVVRVMPSRN
ncbi:hypothetical protein [Streptomyces sp. BPTC-684]|uniref:hypothetical protein n=1 Tax=Streptomyces sp. BPTC-684 TaxID=3043734 RepID=UPI0024B08399|nr:hypothetical protein [Streptomyces sp. BPTC-684]WHM36279.1 hypothetical protein QIY60_04605 [Streptomyces sp. BPTC-684]